MPPLFAALLLLPALAVHAEEIRIDVARGARQARLDAPAAAFVQGPDRRPLETRGGTRHVLAARAGVLLLDGGPVEMPLMIQAGARPIALDGRPLPGTLEAFSEDGRLVLVNTLDLEDYVAAVVASEMPPAWPDAALEAQAVAARTFAIAQKIAQGPAARAHLGASVRDQVYRGAAHPESAALRAARATAGEVLTWGAAPIAAYFSAACGGRSESGEDAFHLEPGSAPYLEQHEVGDADAGAPSRSWTVRRTLAEISAALRKAGRVLAPVSNLSIESRTRSGRARMLRLETAAGPRSIAAVELRQILGYKELPSLLFEVAVRSSPSGKVAVFTGHGMGHGVGLCQWGARGRALRGESYREILAHYYPGVEIRRMY